MLYFDHAATSFPKPRAVADAVSEAIVSYGANPGRSGHQLSQKAAEKVYETRERAAAFLGAPSPKHIWFYQNATYALNQAILGFPLNKGDKIVTTSFEHNSVLRPLYFLQEEKGAFVSYVGGETGEQTAKLVVEAITTETVLIVVNHASNVTGELIPLAKIVEKTKEVGAILLLDASQTAGAVDIHMERDGIDLLACPGHKGLLGPQGTGLLAVGKDVGLAPLVHGGTGHLSELPYQPTTWPERYEAGTVNTPGLAGLNEGLKELERLGGSSVIYKHEQQLTAHFLKGVEVIPQMHLVGSTSAKGRVAVVSFYMDGISSQEVAMILDQHYQIAVRAGLHCAPKLHDWYGTSESGLIRVSFGPYTVTNDVDVLIQALQDVAKAF